MVWEIPWRLSPEDGLWRTLESGRIIADD